MKNALLLLFLFISTLSFGQFGLSTKYELNAYDNWDNHPIDLEEGSFFASDISFGVNYWFRLKKKRVEFLPEMNYTLKNSVSNSANSSDNPFLFENQRYGFRLNTHIYPLDFEGDCNCPTFSKDSEFLKKGLFIILSPSLDFFNFNTTSPDAPLPNQNYKLITFNLGFGIGVDIGISDLITISPFIQYNLFPSIDSGAISFLSQYACPSCDPVFIEDTSNRQIQFGLRFGFRPDYKN